VPREAGQQEQGARTARLPWFYSDSCHSVRVRTAFRCRAYPDETQQQLLARTFGCVRVVWNRTLAARHARYYAEGKSTSYAQTDRALTAMKKDPDLAFLNEVSSVPLQQTLRHQHSAFGAFFARRDFLHKTSTDLVRRFDMIAVEDLNVSGMMKNRPLARAISCTGWAEFRAMLEYKAERNGRQIVITDRFYPSSKTCSACGHLLASLSLGTRHWACPSCGTLHDRDVNAARNVLAAGLAVAACEGDVRHSGSSRVRLPVKQEDPRREPGNSRP
jgi:IS605 OrfB family transposase